MAKYAMLRDYRFTEVAEDIRGAKLYGCNDEKLGKIDDVIFDLFTGQINYVVVDTGGWLTTKKFIVPANRLRMSTEHPEDFAVDLNKQQVEGFPPYHDADLESDEQWFEYEGRYRSKWKADPVMHRAETDRNITPTAQQMPRNSASARAVDSEGVPDADVFTEGGGFAASTDSVVIDNTAVGIGPRWDTFQERLRQRRKEAVTIDDKATGKLRKTG